MSLRGLVVFSIFVLAGLSGCVWVKPTNAGKQVTLVKAFNVKNCTQIGTTTSTVKAQIGSIERSPEKVTNELIALAQNQAADLGGDSIVALRPAEGGSMEFAIYRCRQ
jgi:hypothetical protein